MNELILINEHESIFTVTGGPVFVEVDMVINSVGPVNDKEMVRSLIFMYDS